MRDARWKRDCMSGLGRQWAGRTWEKIDISAEFNFFFLEKLPVHSVRGFSKT